MDRTESGWAEQGPPERDPPAGSDGARPGETERAMSDRDKCPMCADGEVVRTEGQLDQSGATYLPTAVWSCALCGYVRYDPALSAHWRPLRREAEIRRVAA